MLGEQHAAELSEIIRRVVEHREDCDPIGMPQRHLGLHRHQRVDDPISLLTQTGTPQSNDKLEQRLLGQVDPGKTHHQSTSSIGRQLRAARLAPEAECWLPTNQFPSVCVPVGKSLSKPGAA
jgi:hypothetical protein